MKLYIVARPWDSYRVDDIIIFYSKENAEKAIAILNEKGLPAQLFVFEIEV